MSWQEELRRLDEELAAGRLSADDYRVRRDQVLSSAVSQGETPGQQQDPGQPAAAESNQQQAPTADSTQVVRPVDSGQGGPDSTQVVAPAQPNSGQTPQTWQPQSPWGQPGQQAPQSPAPGFQQPPYQANAPSQPPQQQQGAWNAPEADATPPWGGSDLPPMQPPEAGTWASQGPEGFDYKESTGNRGKIITAVVAVVLLGGVAFGAYWLWGRGESGSGPPTNTAAQPPTSTAAPTTQPKEELPVAKLPGATEKHPEVKNFTDVGGLNYLNDKEENIYKTAEPGKTKFLVQHFDNGNLAVFLLVKTSDVESPDKIEKSLADIQISNGAKLMPDAPAGTAVTKYTAEDGSLTQIRAHYFSGDTLVRVEIISAESPESAVTQFKSVFEKQLQKLPADG